MEEGTAIYHPARPPRGSASGRQVPQQRGSERRHDRGISQWPTGSGKAIIAMWLSEESSNLDAMLAGLLLRMLRGLQVIPLKFDVEKSCRATGALLEWLN